MPQTARFQYTAAPMNVRTRFAPSPTGYLHVGGARTALFCWLYARRHGGQFVLRIEDTDRERSSDESVQVILDAMDWLDLAPDEGPFYQTQRFERYAEVTEQLIEAGRAYRCYCSRERLEDLRTRQQQAGIKPRYDGRCRDLDHHPADITPVVRFRNPDTGQLVVEDLVHGRIVFENAELDDLIIRRSDGTPTYNFTVVVDDADMEITHVIRGDDHLNNTPRQVNIYNALDAPIPKFAHLPMILGADGARLSKRHGAVSVLEYRDAGFLPEALLNYLVRLGWSYGDQEVFSREQMVAAFDLADVNRGASRFDPEKLLWLNQHHIKHADAKRLAPVLRAQLEQRDLYLHEPPRLVDVVEVQRDRVKTMVEMAEQSEFVYTELADYDAKAAKKHLRPVAREPLARISESLAQLPEWTSAAINQAVEETAAALGLKMGKVAQPLRVAVTGGPVSPSIDGTLFLLGRERTLARLQKALAFIDARASAD